jgi:hypothetical protein
MRVARAALVAAVLTLTPPGAGAQSGEGRPFAWDVTRAVLIDPTTYAPAIVSHEALRLDWKSSQLLFAHGWVEQNPRFTVSGRPNDVPVSYGEGARRIRRTALTLFQYSALNNLGVGSLERLLIARYPSRRKLFRALSWVERIAYASFVTYRNSADHLKQAGTNRRLAREYGYTTPRIFPQAVGK